MSRQLIMMLATDTIRRRQFVFGTPGEQPGLHVFVANIMAGLELAVSEAEVSAEALLVGDVRLDGIGDEEVGAAAGLASQFGEPLLGCGFQAHAEGGAFCVCHEHIMAWKERGR